MKTKTEIVQTQSGRRLAITYRTVGQHFGTSAQLRSGKTVVAETGVVALGHTLAARDRALALAATL